jgi:hypothetical protein
VLVVSDHSPVIRDALSGLNPKLAELAAEGDEFQFGTRYRRQVEVEYEVTTASAAASRAISDSLRQSLVGPVKAASGLVSPVGAGERNSTVHGVVKIPLDRFTHWLAQASSQHP